MVFYCQPHQDFIFCHSACRFSFFVHPDPGIEFRISDHEAASWGTRNACRLKFCSHQYLMCTCLTVFKNCKAMRNEHCRVILNLYSPCSWFGFIGFWLKPKPCGCLLGGLETGGLNGFHGSVAAQQFINRSPGGLACLQSR